MAVTSDILPHPPRSVATALVIVGAVLTGAVVVALYGEPLRAAFGTWWEATVLPMFLDAQLGGLHICL